MGEKRIKVLVEVEIEEAWSEGYLEDPEVLEQHLTGGLQGIKVKAIKTNDSDVDITKSLELSELNIHPIFKGLAFEIEGRFDYVNLHIEEAKEVIDYLTKSINEREQLKQ